MEIVPKPPEKIPIFKKIFKILFSLCFIFLIFLIIFYFFLFSKISSLKSQRAKLEKQFSQLKTPEIEKIEKEYLLSKVRFSKINDLLLRHLLFSKVFPFFEGKILKKVVLNSFELSAPERKVKISGQAEDFDAVSKQVFILKNSPEIEDLRIERISLSPEGKIDFEIYLSFKESIFK